MMYVKGKMPFTHIIETAPSKVSAPNKFPSHAYISSTPNHLSQQAHLWFDLMRVKLRRETVDPILGWTSFPRELVGCPVTFLYLSQASLVSTRLVI